MLPESWKCGRDHQPAIGCHGELWDPTGPRLPHDEAQNGHDWPLPGFGSIRAWMQRGTVESGVRGDERTFHPSLRFRKEQNVRKRIDSGGCQSHLLGCKTRVSSSQTGEQNPRGTVLGASWSISGDRMGRYEDRGPNGLLGLGHTPTGTETLPKDGYFRPGSGRWVPPRQGLPREIFRKQILVRPALVPPLGVKGAGYLVA